MNHKRILLVNGTVIVPDDCIIVEQTKTSAANYAGIVAEKNSTLPHFLILSETPISEYSVADEDRLYETLGKLHPEIEEVRKNEVEAIFDEEGNVVNSDEWNASPRLGLFPVFEVEDMDNLFFGTGILRQEA
ncbi:MAG: hypothetical protein J6I76_16530 [Oribacterium sp.]|nr:hypothetical protein [Oribacterium sp.]